MTQTVFVGDRGIPTVVQPAKIDTVTSICQVNNAQVSDEIRKGIGTIGILLHDMFEPFNQSHSTKLDIPLVDSIPSTNCGIARKTKRGGALSRSDRTGLACRSHASRRAPLPEWTRQVRGRNLVISEVSNVSVVEGEDIVPWGRRVARLPRARSQCERWPATTSISSHGRHAVDPALEQDSLPNGYCRISSEEVKVREPVDLRHLAVCALGIAEHFAHCWPSKIQRAHPQSQIQARGSTQFAF